MINRFVICLTFLVEAFPAELAHERLVSGVDARVRVERGAAVERFPALVTLMRFFLQVNITKPFTHVDSVYQESKNVLQK